MLIFQGVGLITPVITPTFGWSVWDAWAPHIFSLQSCATDAVRNLLIRSVSMNWYGLQIRNSKTLVLVRWKKDNLIVYINMCIYKTIYIFFGKMHKYESTIIIIIIIIIIVTILIFKEIHPLERCSPCALPFHTLQFPSFCEPPRFQSQGLYPASGSRSARHV